MSRSLRNVCALAKSAVAIGALSLLMGSPAGAESPANPCAAKSMNPCAVKTMNPCAAKAMNPCAAKSLPSVSAGRNPCNPCAMKHNPCNPCAMKHKHNPCNPCAMKHNPCNPCAMKMKHNPCNPCGMKGNPCNPCGMKGNPCNPCGGGAMIDPKKFKKPRWTRLHKGDKAKLVAQGKKLWNDNSLGNSGLACASCHVNDYMLMEDTFAKPYPHFVKMAHQRAGVSKVSAAEMVNFCMLVPMQGEPLGWKSEKLAALAAFVESIRPGFKAASANPCGMKHNPCAMKMKHNPCNPCAMKMKHNPCNPCAMKHNPCAKKGNPCSR